MEGCGGNERQGEKGREVMGLRAPSFSHSCICPSHPHSKLKDTQSLGSPVASFINPFVWHGGTAIDECNTLRRDFGYFTARAFVLTGRKESDFDRQHLAQSGQ